MRTPFVPLALAFASACNDGDREPFGVCVQPSLGQETDRYYDYYDPSSGSADHAVSVSGDVIASGTGEAPSGPCGRWVGTAIPETNELEWFIVRDLADGSTWEVTVSLPGTSGPPELGTEVVVVFAFHDGDRGWARVEDADGILYWSAMEPGWFVAGTAR